MNILEVLVRYWRWCLVHHRRGVGALPQAMRERVGRPTNVQLAGQLAQRRPTSRPPSPRTGSVSEDFGVITWACTKSGDQGARGRARRKVVNKSREAAVVVTAPPRRARRGGAL